MSNITYSGKSDPEKCLFLPYWLCQSPVWSQQTGKFCKRWEYQTNWPASWEICMLIKKRRLDLDMEQQTGSKLGKEYIKAVYCHPAYLTYMQSEVRFSHSVVFDSLRPHGLQQARLACPSLTPRVHSNSCTSSQSCHPTISSSAIPFACLQAFPASGSFPMSEHFASGGQRIGVSDSAPVLPKNIQDLFLLGWTGWISMQSKGLSKVFSNTTVQKHQFFGTQLL